MVVDVRDDYRRSNGLRPLCLETRFSHLIHKVHVWLPMMSSNVEVDGHSLATTSLYCIDLFLFYESKFKRQKSNAYFPVYIM